MGVVTLIGQYQRVRSICSHTVIHKIPNVRHIVYNGVKNVVIKFDKIT